MERSTAGRHTFIVRIWREPREIEGLAPEWRGLIEHIGSGEHRYFRQLEEVDRFIQGYTTLDDADRDA